MVLYPMNALVNDQLGRLRLLLGDPRIVATLRAVGGRPARFARYTSRTLYPGVRTQGQGPGPAASRSAKYYVEDLERRRAARHQQQHLPTRDFVSELKKRGKWPAKPDLLRWYGKRAVSGRTKNGDFKRCVTLPDDPELSRA